MESEKGNLKPLPTLSDPLQKAWNQLVLECIKKGIYHPETPQELVQWLVKPIESWEYFGKVWSELGWSGPLIDGGTPSEICYDLSQNAHESPDNEDHTFTFNKLRDHCQRVGKEYLYTNVRSFLCENPVLTDISYILDIEGIDKTTQNLVREFYEPIPSISKRQGQIVQCMHCGWPLKWKNGLPHCLDNLCREVVNDFLDIKKEQYKKIGENAFQTTWSVQRSIVRPEVTLLKMYEKLKTNNSIQHIELWPKFDRFDLYIVFKDGEAWAIDMKDRQNSYELAIEVNKIHSYTNEPQWNRFIYVFPNHRKKLDRFYLNNFKKSWTNNSDPMFDAMFVDDLINAIGSREFS